MKRADTTVRPFGSAVLGLVLALPTGWPSGAAASGGTWNVELEPVFLEALGHDQHVLTTHEVDADGSPPTDRANAVSLDSEAALAYRARVLHERGSWGYGLDFLIFRTDQQVDPLRASADGPGSAIDQRIFEVAGRRFASTGPGQVLYFQTLEDTTVELWVLDLYATRVLAETPGSSLVVVLGVRNADFDNDYRAVAGVEGVGGVRIDASSNYSRMIGPLVGLSARLERGRHSFGGDLRQSVVLGEIELSRTLRDFSGSPGAFAGPPEEVPPGLAQDRLVTQQDIAVPMTDVRVLWGFRLTDHVALGLSLGATVWWDLAVPPGVQPGPGGDERLNENTIVTYGLGATLKVKF
ncbi:MAG TPA: hypothetical protein VF017_11690 [Thermoanaerobaculia bacterium]|nr:hypothetical protein [Thermoanaerobaculia bacterium]